VNENENDTPWGAEMDLDMDAVLLAADEAAVTALRAQLDVEGKLVEVLARAEAGQVFAAGTRTVLASWSLELTAAAVRAHGAEWRVVRPINDQEFFAAATGRPRVGLDPWPDVQLAISPDQGELRAVLSLPNRPPRGTAVLIVASHGSWTAECVFEAGALAEADELWAFDLTARLALPDGAAGDPDLVVNLQVVGTGE
jgi:hypothetical protein